MRKYLKNLPYDSGTIVHWHQLFYFVGLTFVSPDAGQSFVEDFNSTCLLVQNNTLMSNAVSDTVMKCHKDVVHVKNRIEP